MPLPTPRNGESRKDFVSRCIGILSSRGEGKDSSQRAAMCHSQFTKSVLNLVKAEIKKK